MPQDNPILRQVEAEVLDKYHLRFSLLQRNTNEAIHALLLCYGNILRGLGNGTIAKGSDEARNQTENQASRGLAHCLRWIGECCPRNILVASPRIEILLEEALKLLRWSVKYDPLVNLHSAYSRKIGGKRLVNAEVNESAKTISFSPIDSGNIRFFVTQVKSKIAEDARAEAIYPESDLAKLSSSWYESMRRGQSGVRFDDSTIAASGALEIAIEWLGSCCIPECPDNVSLGNFTVGEIRRILAALHIGSMFRVKLEDYSDAHIREVPRVLTHVLSWTTPELIQWLFELTKIEKTAISAITSLLTLDDLNNSRVTVAHQPLIRGTSDRLFLSPRLFLKLPVSQMVSGALNLKPETRTAYDHASTTIEGAVVKRIAVGIRKGCFTDAELVVERTFRLSNGSLITPDIVVRLADAKEVLIIDIKNAIPPFGVSDIQNDLKVWLEDTQVQMLRYLDGFRAEPSVISQHFSSRVHSPSYFGLVIMRWPFPVAIDISSGLAVIDWPTMLEHLSTGAVDSGIESLLTWIRERPDCGFAEKFLMKQKHIIVDEWTYCYSVVTESEVAQTSKEVA